MLSSSASFLFTCVTVCRTGVGEGEKRGEGEGIWLPQEALCEELSLRFPELAGSTHETFCSFSAWVSNRLKVSGSGHLQAASRRLLGIAPPSLSRSLDLARR